MFSKILPSFITNCFSKSEVKKEAKNIFEAAQIGDVAALEKFVANGAEVSKMDARGWTPLHYASRQGHIKSAEFLVKSGADVNQLTTGKFYSPLYLACHNNREEFTDFLIDKGADVNQRIHNNSTTPLHIVSSMENRVNMIQCLIYRGASIGEKDQLGRTPLHVANSLKEVNALVGKGASLFSKDSKGRTPLQTAFEEKKWNLLRPLTFDRASFWQEVKVEQFMGRDKNGKYIFENKMVLFDHRTTDLYPIENTHKLRAKCAVISAIAIPYIVIAITSNVLQIVSDIAFSVWNKVSEVKNISLGASLYNFSMLVMRDIPGAFVNRVYLAVQSPFIAIGELFLGMYGLYDPLEGRKFLNSITGSNDGLLYITGMQKLGNVAESKSDENFSVFMLKGKI